MNMPRLQMSLEKLLNCLLFAFVFLLANFLSTYAEVQEDEVFLRGKIFYGNASWYGGKFHGRKTSNGEKFNKHRLTAAHLSLPFDTKVKVTNMRNNKSVIVRINDRGPHRSDRIIDLSEKAAKKLEGDREGIIYVKVQVLNKPGGIFKKFSDKKRRFFRSDEDKDIG